MHEIFLAVNQPLAQFLKTRVSDTLQDSALRKASEHKLSRVTETLLDEPDRAANLVTALGRVTASLQSRSPSMQHLRSPERGVFIVNSSDRIAAGVDYELIREAAEAGYLHFAADSSRREWRFRIHTSLAPHFGSSYRGAYYKTELSLHELNLLAEARDDKTLNKLVAQVLVGIEGHPAPVQMRLSVDSRG
jgi:hypothetical protein